MQVMCKGLGQIAWTVETFVAGNSICWDALKEPTTPSRKSNFCPAVKSSETVHLLVISGEQAGYVAEVTANAMVWTQKYLLGPARCF